MKRPYRPTAQTVRFLEEARQISEKLRANPPPPVKFSDHFHDTGFGSVRIVKPPKRPNPKRMQPLLAYAQGALYGLAVGDALGATTEFSEPRDLPAYPTLVTGPHREIIGAGKHAVAPGQVTDDTQMATCIVDAFLAKGADVTSEDFAERYTRWVPFAFDAGRQTRAALALVASGVPAREAGKRLWLEGNKHAAPNGSLMRTAPIGVFFARNQKRRRAATIADSIITHFDPRCVLACVGFNGAIASAVRGELRVKDMLASCEEDLRDAADELRRGLMRSFTDEVTRAEEELLLDFDLSDDPDPAIDQKGLHLIGTQGFVRVAFRLAFWHLRHTEDFAAAMIDVVNRGGDTDTNAAITGALLGARLGVDAIPRSWRDAVLAAVPRQGPESPLATTYHPRTMLTKTAALLDKDLPGLWEKIF